MEVIGFYVIFAGIGILCAMAGATVLAIVMVIWRRTRPYGIAVLLTGALIGLAFAFFAAISELHLAQGVAINPADLLSAAAISGVVGFGIGLFIGLFMVGFVVLVLAVRAAISRSQLHGAGNATTASR